MADQSVSIALNIRGAAEATRDVGRTSDAFGRLGERAEHAGDQTSTMGRKAEGAIGRLKRLGSAALGVAGTITKIGAVTVAAAGVFSLNAIAMATDAGEVESAFGETFGAATASMQAYVDATTALSGQTTDSVQDALTVFGSFAKAAKISEDQVGAFSTELVTAANDLASFKNADPSKVIEDLQSGLSGSIETLRKYGIFMSDAGLSAQATAMGFGDTFSALSEGEKIMVRQAFIMDNLGDAAGDLARTAESPANSFRFLTGRGEEAVGMIGSGFMPAVAAVMPSLRRLATDGIQLLADHLPALTAWSERAGMQMAAWLDNDLPVWFARAQAAIETFRADGVAGLSGELGGAIDGLVTFGEAMGGPLQLGFEIAQTAAPIVIKAFELLGEHADVLAPLIVSVGAGLLAFHAGGAAANAALAPIGGVRGAITGAQLATAALQLANTLLAGSSAAVTVSTGAQTTATVGSRVAMVAAKIQTIAVAAASKAFAAAQWLVNAALTANPIGIVVVAIGALVAALVWAYQNSETFRNVVNGAFESVKNVAGATLTWIGDNWRTILTVLTGPVGRAVVSIVDNWEKIKAGFTTAWDGITSAFGRVSDTLDRIWGRITDRARGAVNGLIGQINSVIDAANMMIRGLDAITPGSMGRIGRVPEMRADGGRVTAGQPYIVGEHRAELFVPDSAGTILPRTSTGGGIGTVNVTIHQQPGESTDVLVDRMVDQLGRAIETRAAWA